MACSSEGRRGDLAADLAGNLAADVAYDLGCGGEGCERQYGGAGGEKSPVHFRLLGGLIAPPPKGETRQGRLGFHSGTA